ncbi:MAG: hypothetical protein GQ569_05910 [Methylococcaceae bacterium]|nr:hypothetical protein [Methylococcaceae bacterium]
MRYCLRILLLALCSFPAIAEHKEGYKNQIYTKSSNAAVQSLNDATEALRNPTQLLKKVMGIDETNKTDKQDLKTFRDPTKMNDNFRQALKNIRPTSNAKSDDTNTAMPQIPDISLAAKVLGRAKASSVILKINKSTLHIFEGKSASFVENHKVITIRVDEIKKTHVSIFVSPHNQQLILQ